MFKQSYHKFNRNAKTKIFTIFTDLCYRKILTRDTITKFMETY